jgi:hypothetical protein
MICPSHDFAQTTLKTRFHASIHTDCYMHSERMKLIEHLVDLVVDERTLLIWSTNHSDAINN